MYTVLKEQKLS